MAKQETADFLTLPLPIPRGGLNKDIEPTSLERAYSPFMMNMIIEANRIRKRLGYRDLGRNTPLDGVGTQLISYPDARGTTHTIAVTTTHAFEYNGTAEMWVPITPSTYLEDCETGWAAGSGDTVDHDSTVGDYIRTSKSVRIILAAERSDGDQLAYKDISSVDISAHTHIGFWIKASTDLAANSIEIVVSESNHAAGEKTGTYVECLAGALTAGTWSFVCLEKTLTDFNAVVSCSIYANTTLAAGVVLKIDDIRAFTPLAGDATKRVAWTIAHDLNEFTNNGGSALLISNGVDDVYQYEGHANDKMTTLVHGYASFANTFEIDEFWNHLMFINFNNGSQNVRSVAWADVGDVDDFSAGTSGLSYLTDSRGKLLRASKLGSDLILYSQRSITTCRYHGGTVVFLFPTLIYQTGIYAHSALVGLSTGHLFLGTDQRIYEYRGGLQLMPIGKNIEASFFAELNSTNKDHIACGYDEASDRAYFAFPRAQDTYAKGAYCLNRRQPGQPWEYFEFAHGMKAFAMHEAVAAWYCDDTQFSGVYCDEAAFHCDASAGSEGYPTMISLDSDGNVYTHDEALGQDENVDIPCWLHTMDVTVDKEEHFGRWEWLTFTAMSKLASGTVTIFYSTDEGQTTTQLNDSPVTLTSAWVTTRIPLDVVSRKIRFIFYQNSAADLQIRDDMHVGVIPLPARS